MSKKGGERGQKGTKRTYQTREAQNFDSKNAQVYYPPPPKIPNRVEATTMGPTVSSWTQTNSEELQRASMSGSQRERQEAKYSIPPAYGFHSEIIKFVSGQPLLYMGHANEPSTSTSQRPLQENVSRIPYYGITAPLDVNLCAVPRKPEKLKYSDKTIPNIPTVVSGEYKECDAVQKDNPLTYEPQPSTSGFVPPVVPKPVCSSQQDCSTKQPASTSTNVENPPVTKYVSIPYLKDTVYTTTPHGILLQPLKCVPIADVMPQQAPLNMRSFKTELDMRTKPRLVGYEWLTPEVQVRIRELSKEPDLVGLYGTICFITDDMCAIYLKGRNRVVYLSHGQIEPAVPVRGDQVKVVMGPDEGKLGVLFSILGGESIIKYSNGNIKVMSSNYICKLELIPDIIINYLGKLTSLSKEALKL